MLLIHFFCTDCRFTFNCNKPRAQHVDTIRGHVRYHMIKFLCTTSEPVSLQFEKTFLNDKRTNLVVRESALNYEEKFDVTPKHDNIYHVKATLTFPYFNWKYYSGFYILRGCSSADPSNCKISPKALIIGKLYICLKFLYIDCMIGLVPTTCRKYEMYKNNMRQTRGDITSET